MFRGIKKKKRMRREKMSRKLRKRGNW